MNSRGLFFIVLVAVTLAHTALFYHVRVTCAAVEIAKERVVAIHLQARPEPSAACPHPQPEAVSKPEPVPRSETVSVTPPRPAAVARPQPKPVLPAPVSEPKHEREATEVV